jgi:hypothetical protein
MTCSSNHIVVKSRYHVDSFHFRKKFTKQKPQKRDKESQVNAMKRTGRNGGVFLHGCKGPIGEKVPHNSRRRLPRRGKMTARRETEGP